MIRLGLRSTRMLVRMAQQTTTMAVRLNTTSSASQPSLALQIYPIDKESISEKDVDEWLHSLQRLKNGYSPETATEIYLDELTNPEQHLKQGFEPTAEQLEEKARFEQTKVPLANIPVVENMVNLIMRHGKKSLAKKTVSRALYIVFLKLRKDPVLVLQETLDKLGPLMTTKVEKTGFAKNRVVPYPLNERQRNRFAILWILEGAEKKKSPDYSVRLAEEIISAYEGKSSGYDRKAQMHRLAISQRAYIKI